MFPHSHALAGLIRVGRFPRLFFVFFRTWAIPGRRSASAYVRCAPHRPHNVSVNAKREKKEANKQKKRKRNERASVISLRTKKKNSAQ